MTFFSRPGGMGFACLMSVLEFIFKGGSLERKVKSLRKFNFLLDKLTTNQGPLMEADGCTYFRKNPHIVANSNLSLLHWKFMVFSPVWREGKIFGGAGAHQHKLKHFQCKCLSFGRSEKQFKETSSRLPVLSAAPHVLTRSQVAKLVPAHPFPSLLAHPPSLGDLCLVSGWTPG